MASIVTDAGHIIFLEGALAQVTSERDQAIDLLRKAVGAFDEARAFLARFDTEAD